MTRRQKIRDIYNDLKDGLRFCELCETENLNGEVVGYHQGLSFSMGWDGRYNICTQLRTMGGQSNAKGT